MYLVDSAAPPINNRKWNLGRFRMGSLGLSPVRLPNLGGSGTAQTWRHLSGRRMRGLGAATDAGYCTYFAADGVTPESFDLSTTTAECAQNGGEWTAALNVPTPVGAQNPSPVAGGASNGGITTVMATTPSKSPLDYTSPQAAIAAGLPASQVMAAWSAALARFPSPQAAISAGIPAGVVNQLWQQSNVNAANASAASAASTAQLSSILPWAAGGLLLFAAFSGGGKRR
jgi:hypothetical protein